MGRIKKNAKFSKTKKFLHKKFKSNMIDATDYLLKKILLLLFFITREQEKGKGNLRNAILGKGFTKLLLGNSLLTDKKKRKIDL